MIVSATVDQPAAKIQRETKVRRITERVRVAALLATAVAAMGLPIFAQDAPISIKGLDWSQSTKEQLAILQRDGLACLPREHWRTIPRSASEPKHLGSYFCVETDAPADTERWLDYSYGHWVESCMLDQTSCWDEGEAFRHELEKVLRVTLYEDDKITFDCSYLNACSFGPKDIQRELQARVHPGPWEKPTEDAYIICATGPLNEALCVHWGAKAVLLMKQSLRSRMEF